MSRNATNVMMGLFLALVFAMAGCGGGGSGGAPNNPGATQQIALANAGSNKSVNTGTLVQLDGNASQANSGILTYFWHITAKPNGSTAALSANNIVNPTFTPDVAGVYTIGLVVTDSVSTSTESTITVTATLPAAPVANAGSPQSVTTGIVVTLDGSASTVAQGKTASYSWAITSKPTGSAASITNPTTAKPTFTPDIAGTFTFTLTVSDGSSNATGTVTVTADALNSISVAPLDRTISLGQTKQYLATGVFATAGSKDISTVVTWVSSNTVVATINGSGLATSTGQGTTTIPATLAGITSTTTLTVGPVTLVSMAINNGFSVDLVDGQTLQLQLTGTYSNGTTSNITEQATWSVPFFDANKVSVSNTSGTKGFVRTLGVLGTAQIHAAYLGLDEVIFVNVK